MTFQDLLREKRPYIERLVRGLARQHYLSAAEAEDFRRAVDTALERNNYELLRAFEGRSTWETYLETTIFRLFFAFQEQLWGSWRPSFAAQRLGNAAVLLEELVTRDGVSVPEAIEILRTRHGVDLPRFRLEQIAEQLRLSGEPAVDGRSSEAQAREARLQAALADAMALVSPEDRLVLELRFRDRQPLTRIARVMNTEVRPLQRRLDQVIEVLRRALLTQGIAVYDLDVLFEQGDGLVAQTRWWNAVLPRGGKR